MVLLMLFLRVGMFYQTTYSFKAFPKHGILKLFIFLMLPIKTLEKIISLLNNKFKFYLKFYMSPGILCPLIDNCWSISQENGHY